jgi:hypothetical protein
VNLVQKEERRGPKTWPKGTNRDMKRTRRILVARPGSRVDAYVTKWVREMMKVKHKEMNGKRIR